MSFLQPLLLLGLPLIGLPILIHLMNQRRFQTMQWGAMYFLLAANRMSRGFARIRRWLILAARTVVVAGILFTMSRPLASGWLGLAVGSRTDTTIVLFDRSASMSAMDARHTASKLTSGRRQLADALTKLRSDHWVLIDSVGNQPIEIANANDLLSVTDTQQSGASADLPAMLQAAYQYVQSNQTGRTDIWICSDLRQHDWDADGGRWEGLRDSFLQLPQAVRFYLLAFPDLPFENRSIRVTSVQRHAAQDGPELLVSLEIKRGAKREAESLPLEFNIDGARSVLNVELTGPTFELADHRIPLGGDQVRGWGRVAIPADALPLDNEFFFVFDRQPVRRTLIVADEPQWTRPLRLAAEIPVTSSTENAVELIGVSQVEAVAWEEIGLVLWCAPFPKAADALLLQSYVDAGGSLIFLPPQIPSTESCFGLTWESWQDLPDETVVNSWRGDSGLLANSEDGMSLPVGELAVKWTCPIQGDLVALASLSNGQPLLVRVPTDRGGVYALTTTVRPRDSSLARDGVVLYVMIQRALIDGSARLMGAQQADTGTSDDSTGSWQRVAGAENALSHQLHYHGGVFQADDRLWAFNRAADEDDELTLSTEQVDRLFAGLPYARVNDQAGAVSSLVREIWRIFLIAMLLAMVAEAVLCLPRRPVQEGVLV